MAVSFTFNAGPLASIGFNVLSLDTAYHLAVGAYGWYKARERSQSLVEVFKIAGGNLVVTPSFSREQYLLSRSQRSEMQGLVIQEGQVLPTALPKASTALPDDPGLACLRALVTGLLCFYDIDATTVILSHVIPDGLIQLDLEDTTFTVEGPKLFALREYIGSVATEEDSNTFRKYLLDQASICQSTLTGSPVAGIQACDPAHSNDIHLVIGVLKWILLPVYKRAMTHYATRSLRVWTVAVVVQILGFEVLASSETIGNQAEYDRILHANLGLKEYGKVALVTGQDGETDRMQPAECNPAGYHGLRPQIMPMRGIPWSAFRHVRGSASKVNTQFLVDVWNYSYSEARSSVHPPKFDKFGFVRFETTNKAQDLAFESHRNLIRMYSPELGKICGKSMDAFVPRSSNSPSWDPDAMSTWLEALERDQHPVMPANIDLADNSLIITAIVLGTIYGVVSRCCFDDSKEMDGYSEIAFRPDLLLEQDRLRGWATAVGRAVGGVIRYEDWNGCVFEVVLGKDFGIFHGASAEAGRQHSTDFTTASLHAGKQLFGGQENGMAAISRMAICPSTDADSLMIFHVHRGQILSLPLSDDGYIQGADWSEPSAGLTLEPRIDLEFIQREGWNIPDTSTRADVEPCWERNPHCIILRIRRMGSLVAAVNLARIGAFLTRDRIICNCRAPSQEVSAFTHSGWQCVKAEALMDNPIRRNASTHRAAPSSREEKVLVDARRSHAMSLYCMGIIMPVGNACISTCIRCASQDVEGNPHKTIIILSM